MAKYKAAVIGLGNIGLLYDLEPQRPHPSTHVFAYSASNMFDFVCGIDGDERKKTLLHEAIPHSLFFSNIEEALRTGVLRDVDVISVCTPPNTHLDIVRKLLRLNIGKIIFCEKPIVSDLEETKILLAELELHKNIIVIPNISRRWNKGLNRISTVIHSKTLGKLEKIHVRYTRGIENTGAHLFDLLKMWTGQAIKRVYALGETHTSALPEPTYSFYFEFNDGVSGFAEAIDDSCYYLFEIDLYLSNGKIEMRNSGDDVICYRVAQHHLFAGFKELVVADKESGLLQDACIKNAVNNISNVLEGIEKPKCSLHDAIYPLLVADRLRASFANKRMEEIDYV